MKAITGTYKFLINKHEDAIVATFCSKFLKNSHFWVDCSKFLGNKKGLRTCPNPLFFNGGASHPVQGLVDFLRLRPRQESKTCKPLSYNDDSKTLSLTKSF
jgi:hypothetical protein